MPPYRSLIQDLIRRDGVVAIEHERDVVGKMLRGADDEIGKSGAIEFRFSSDGSLQAGVCAAIEMKEQLDDGAAEAREDGIAWAEGHVGRRCGLAVEPDAEGGGFAETRGEPRSR